MNIQPFQAPGSPSRQRGMSLLEILIAVLILGIGVLGIAAMQASALRNSQSSMQRSQAVIAANTMLDSIRANPSGVYGLATMTCTAPASDGSIAGADQHQWITDMQSSIGPNTCGQITSAGGIWKVSVQWSDSADSTQSTVTLASRVQ